MKEKFFYYIPKRTLFPLILLMLMNFAVYWGTKAINHNWYHYDLTTEADKVIPLVPFFLVFYFLAYVQWVFGFIIISRENDGLCYKVVSGEIISKLICAVFFLAMPTAIVRPEVTSSGVFGWGVKLLYTLDVPTNLFPSIHCLESWLCFRYSVNLKKPPRWYKWFMLFITLNVFASVVFLKQHFFVDILAGVAVAEFGQLTARLTGSGRIFEKINTNIFKIEAEDVK